MCSAAAARGQSRGISGKHRRGPQTSRTPSRSPSRPHSPRLFAILRAQTEGSRPSRQAHFVRRRESETERVRDRGSQRQRERERWGGQIRGKRMKAHKEREGERERERDDNSQVLGTRGRPADGWPNSLLLRLDLHLLQRWLLWRRGTFATRPLRLLFETGNEGSTDTLNLFVRDIPFVPRDYGFFQGVHHRVLLLRRYLRRDAFDR